MNCPNCGVANRAEAKFCLECGSPLSAACPNGHPVPPNARFCDECGAAVRAGVVAPASTAPAGAQPGPSAERRLVSVLFADLVGFTSLSEGRDAEDVRELLGRYFDTARRLVALYGGTIEKFIGDAVMAVWGTPVAQEDDAERAVRAALDLTAAVAELGDDAGAPGLRARAGVLTGEAAVTLGAAGQGMVAGDLVNTASRIQSAASPGSVFVGEATRRASEASIVYEDTGAHEMKGKTDPVPLWRALRVVAGRKGALKSSTLEAPFVGRDRELRAVKELLHASAEERKAHLLSVVGIAGIGKSRLTWEFEKYVDGLLEVYRWHRGRCLAYGEGVAYWALAEMVRMRARIAEGEDQESAAAKLRDAVEQYVKDPEERDWIEPRLAHLLGLEERTARDPEDLFSAWRLFIERMAEEGPTILVFEDMQWADQSLVDFVDYLMNWSKNHPIFVVLLARPDFVDRHAGLGSGRRGFTTLFLDPLSADAMEELLTGLVPGLTAPIRAKILERAQGVPLYAVETLRMLLDKGLLVQEGNAYRPTGPIEHLDVPETLQALIAARLDGLEPSERRLIQDAAVLGKTFTKASLVALSGLPDEGVDGLLSSLLRKELLSIQADPRSPERGQYGFLQDLVRRVAYDTLSRRDRKTRHLAAAAYLETGWGPDDEEIVEVVASHYLEAYEAVPDAPDAAEIKAKARDALTHAGRRAASLAATEEARRYFEQAVSLADDPVTRAELHEHAGTMARKSGRNADAVAHFEEAIALFEAAGKTHPAARVSASYGGAIRDQGRFEEALERMQAAFEVLAGEEPDADLATLAAEQGRLLLFAGETAAAQERIELALTTAEMLMLPEVFSQALNTKSLILQAQGRVQEALALLQHALKVALDNDLADAALRAHNNIGATFNERDRHEDELDTVIQIVALARKVGSRIGELRGLAGQISALYYLGMWREALDVANEVTSAWDETPMGGALVAEQTLVPPIHVLQGDTSVAREVLQSLKELADTKDIQDRGSYLVAEAWVLYGEGRLEEAVRTAEEAFRTGVEMGIRNPVTKEATAIAVESALALGDLETVERRIAEIEGLRPGEVTPYVASLAPRFRARLRAARGETEGVAPEFRTAEASFREWKFPFWLAVTLLEHGEWLISQSRAGDAVPLLAEAREIFERLQARPYLDRVARAIGDERLVSRAN